MRNQKVKNALPMKTQLKHDSLQLANGEASLTAADITVLKSFNESLQQCFASLLNGELQEPFKSQFAKIKEDINLSLAKLVPSDQAPAALRADDTIRSLLWMFQRAQEVITNLGKVASGARETAMASLSTEVDNKISTMLASGDIIKKADFEQKLADAVAAAKSGVQAEMKRIGDRRTQLASAKILVPSDDLLAGEDKDFTDRKTRAEGRLAKLAAFTALPEDRRIQLAWAADDAKFAESLELMTAALGTATPPPAGKPNGFAVPAPAPAKPALSRVGVV